MDQPPSSSLTNSSTTITTTTAQATTTQARPIIGRLVPTNALTKLSKVSSPIDIQTTDVIKIIQQYLQEQGLYRSLHSLQEESQITTNTVNNTETFLKNIEFGNWDKVLEELSSFRIPITKLIPLYDEIILELCEYEEFETASLLFQQTPIFLQLKRESLERYEKLQRFITHLINDPNQLYEKISKKYRRLNISQILSTEITSAPKGRLLQIITNSLRYQQFTGTLPQHISDYSLFTNNISTKAIETQRPVIEQIRQISLHIDDSIDLINIMIFSYNGKYLITGNDKGIIEIWDIETGKPTNDLEYQRNYEYMMHFHSITTLALSHDNEILASGSQNGDIKIWSFYTGECIIDMKQSHIGSVITHLQFSNNGLTLLTASDDNTVKIWDLTNQINTFTYNIDNNIIFIYYSSINLSNLNSNYILILDSNGIFYLYFDQDLIIKKQLISNSSLQGNTAHTLTTAAAAAAAAQAKDQGLDISTLVGGGGSRSGGKNDSNSNLSASTTTTSQSTALSLYNAFPIPIRPDVLIICSKNDHSIHTMNDKTGDLIMTYNLNNPKNTAFEQTSTASSTSPSSPQNLDQQKILTTALSKADITHACTSALSKYIYAVTTNNYIVVFNFENGKIEHVFNPHDSSLIMSICHHPHRNILVTSSADGYIRIWK